MSIKEKAKKTWEIFGAIFIVCFLAFSAYEFVVSKPKSQKIQWQLENEFQSIMQLPGLVSTDYSAGHGTSKAWVRVLFQTDYPYTVVREHYEAELLKNGWIAYQEDEMREWGVDLGGKIARYCKDEYRSDLQYSGDKANHDWEYSFSMSWGLDALVDIYFGKFESVGCR